TRLYQKLRRSVIARITIGIARLPFVRHTVEGSMEHFTIPNRSKLFLQINLDSKSYGALYHSQSREAIFANQPGLKFVMPSTPFDIIVWERHHDFKSTWIKNRDAFQTL